MAAKKNKKNPAPGKDPKQVPARQKAAKAGRAKAIKDSKAKAAKVNKAETPKKAATRKRQEVNAVNRISSKQNGKDVKAGKKGDKKATNRAARRARLGAGRSH